MDYVLSSVYLSFRCSQLQDVFKSQNAKNGGGQIGLGMFRYLSAQVLALNASESQKMSLTLRLTLFTSLAVLKRRKDWDKK